MKYQSHSRPGHVLLLLGAAFLAVLLAVAATGLWHTHSNAAEAAACRVCHVGSTPSAHPPITVLAPPAPVVEGCAALPAFTETPAPVCISKPSRAPPFAA
jgi:hypothetical protein